MAEKKNEVMTMDEEKALAVANEQQDFFAEMETEDFNVPFTRVLADMSALVKEGEFSAGQIYNTGSGEAVDSMEVVIVRKPEKTITVRTDEGDYVASYPYTMEKLAELTNTQDGLKRWDAEGNSVYETWNYYIMDLSTEDISICAMSSSNYTAAKAWNTRIRLQKRLAPSQMVWKLSTKMIGKGKKTYWVFDTPKFKGQVPEDKVEAVEFAKEMFSTAKVDHSKGFESESSVNVEDSDF